MPFFTKKYSFVTSFIVCSWLFSESSVSLNSVFNNENMQDFVHLHVHTQYSILDGQASIPRLVDKAIANGMRGIAVTDHGDMFGIKEFFNYVNKKNGGTNGEIKDLKKKIAALESGKAESENPEADLAACREQLEAAKKKLFKPIIGCEMYVARRRLTDKEGKADQSGYHLVVLAKKPEGLSQPYQIGIESMDRGILYASAYRPCGTGKISRRTDCLFGMFGWRDSTPHYGRSVCRGRRSYPVV